MSANPAITSLSPDGTSYIPTPYAGETIVMQRPGVDIDIDGVRTTSGRYGTCVGSGMVITPTIVHVQVEGARLALPHQHPHGVPCTQRRSIRCGHNRQRNHTTPWTTPQAWSALTCHLSTCATTHSTSQYLAQTTSRANAGLLSPRGGPWAPFPLSNSPSTSNKAAVVSHCTSAVFLAT